MEYKSLYTSSDDPQFEDGEIVEVDTFYFGGNINYAKYVEGVVIGQGKVGYSSSTYWIVDFGNTNYTPGAKYRAALVSPGAIVKREDDLSQLAINIENKVLKIESVLDEMAKDLEQLKKIK